MRRSCPTSASASGTRLLKRYPDLHDIRDACDKAYEPIDRRHARDRAAQSHNLALAAPAKSDQARRDEQFIDYETRIKPLLTSGPKLIDPVPAERVHDGKHWNRIAADLEARKARNNTAKETEAT